MSRIKIKIELKNNNEIIRHETEGIKTGNILKYISDKTIETFDIENLKLKRKTKEYTNIIDFKQQTSTITYNEFEMKLKIKTINKEIQEQQIIIKYEIIDTKGIYEYKIIWR